MHPRQLRRIGTAVAVAAAISFGASACFPQSVWDPDGLSRGKIDLSMPNIAGDRPFIEALVTLGDSKPLPMLLDTGAPGLRVFKEDVPNTGVSLSGEPATLEFVDGTEVTGEYAEAVVEIGDYSTGKPITIQVIDEVNCSESNPECSGAAGVRELRSHGFAGILGIGLMAANAYSPLLQLSGGSPTSFTVSTDPESGSGLIAFNVTPREPTAEFALARDQQNATHPNGVPAWNSNAINACWAVESTAPQCYPTSFDTGAPFGVLPADEATTSAPTDVPRGVTVSLFPPNSDDPIWTYPAGTQPGKNLVRVQPTRGGSSPSANSGVQVFGAFSVTYDIRSGSVVLLEDRSTAASS